MPAADNKLAFKRIQRCCAPCGVHLQPFGSGERGYPSWPNPLIQLISLTPVRDAGSNRRSLMGFTLLDSACNGFATFPRWPTADA